MLKNKEELLDFINEMNLEDCLYFSEEETIKAIIGFEDAERCLVYDYDKLIECFIEHFRKYNENATEEELVNEATEWVEYNTIRSLPYKTTMYKIYNKEGENIDTTYSYTESQKILEKTKEGRIEEINYKNPIIIHNLENYGF